MNPNAYATTRKIRLDASPIVAAMTASTQSQRRPRALVQVEKLGSPKVKPHVAAKATPIRVRADVKGALCDQTWKLARKGSTTAHLVRMIEEGHYETRSIDPGRLHTEPCPRCADLVNAVAADGTTYRAVRAVIAFVYGCGRMSSTIAQQRSTVRQAEKRVEEAQRQLAAARAVLEAMNEAPTLNSEGDYFLTQLHIYGASLSPLMFPDEINSSMWSCRDMMNKVTDYYERKCPIPEAKLSDGLRALFAYIADGCSTVIAFDE